MAATFPELKPFQKNALHSLNSHPHTVLIAATGSGKSLVFQKYLYDSRAKTRALFISPLNALARQIASGLEEIGVPVKLGVGRAGQGPPEGSGVWIVSPEKIFGAGYDRARAWKPNCLMVDEAHCVWEWGEEFRPEFARVPNLVKELSIPKSFWCSATLPTPSLRRITQNLEGHQVLGQFSMPTALQINRLQISSHHKLAHLRVLLEKDRHSSGMIFVSTRASAERLRLYLLHWGFTAIFYHAGMSTEERVALEKRLANHDSKNPVWVVATSAFGMGMNYPFLKTCILFEPSLSLLSLAQALGRVGRSGASAQAYVLWHENDFRSLEAMMDSPSEHVQRLRQVKTWCATMACPKEQLEKYFNATEKSGTFEAHDHS